MIVARTSKTKKLTRRRRVDGPSTNSFSWNLRKYLGSKPTGTTVAGEEDGEVVMVGAFWLSVDVRK
jgi:hypothetical protein